MGKRAPILPEGYNPVGEALKKAINPPVLVERPPPQEKVINLKPEEDAINKMSSQISMLKEKEPIPEVPTDIELKRTSFRFRCTENERKRWHSMAQELTGEHSQLSHFARATFMLMEHAFEELTRFAPDIQRLKYPAKADALGLTLYEQRLAEFLFDAIKASGRPRG